jgi:hypothetical protein
MCGSVQTRELRYVSVVRSAVTGFPGEIYRVPPEEIQKPDQFIYAGR